MLGTINSIIVLTLGLLLATTFRTTHHHKHTEQLSNWNLIKMIYLLYTANNNIYIIYTGGEINRNYRRIGKLE